MTAVPGPGMTVDTVAQFVETLRAAQLLPPEQADQLPALQAQFPTVPALARELVKRGWLTPFQANQLARGRGAELALGPYHLLEPLGEGGMGTVYKARHPLMKRVVALKVIRAERFSGADAIRRFEREIVVAGKLSHPNVVIAHDAVRVGKTLVLVTEYVEGTDLAKLMRQRGTLPAGEACEYIRQASLGLQHASEQGLVHRDIKPANLMVTARGGLVKVLDMGLALLGSSGDSVTALTESGMVMGTPDYMAPEQADNAHTVDIRADIYSLGCTLYALLSGHVPFPGNTLSQKIAARLHSEPKPLEGLRPDLPPGLVAVVRRMMAKRPEDRYRTPAEAAAALQPFCQPPPASQSGVALPSASGPWSAATQAETVAANASTQASSHTAPVRAVSAESTLPFVPAPRARGIPKVWLLAGAGAGALLLVVVLVLALGGSREPAPDTANPGKGSGSQTLALEPDPNAPTIEIRKFIGHDQQVNCVALSRDGALALSGSTDRTMRLWDAKTGAELHVFQVGKGVWGVAFSADGKYALASEGGWWGKKGYETAPPYDVVLYDVAARKEVRRYGGYKGEVQAVAFLPDGRTFLSSSQDEGLVQCEVEGGKKVREFRELTAFLNLPLSADGRLALLNDANHALRLWNVRDWESVRVLRGHKDSLRGVALSADGRRALSSSMDKDVRLWDVTTGKELRALAPHPSVVTGLALTADGRWGATGGGITRDPATGAALSKGGDDVIRLFDLDSGKEIRRLEGHTAAIMTLTFSTDGRYLLSGACDATVRLWRWAK